METIALTESQYGDLRTAFEQSSYDTECYLDTDEGEVLWFSPDTPGVDQEPDEDAPEWKQEAYEKRRRVWEDDSGRFFRVPPADPSDVRDDVEVFLEEHADARLRNRIDSDRPTRASFEPFRRAVERDPEARSQWRQFRRKRTRERIDEWLDLKGYRLVVDEP